LFSPQGAEKVVEIAAQGQTFGEAEMFLERSHLVTAQALEPSLLLHISAAAIFNELDRDPQFVRKIIAALSLRLHQLVGDLEAYSLHSGCQRLIDYLLRDQPTDRDEPISMTLPVSKCVIASRLNMKQETLSRILQNLSAMGLVVVDGRTVHIPEVRKLRAHGQ
jgi:CRP-like cAMP-binding protein